MKPGDRKQAVDLGEVSRATRRLLTRQPAPVLLFDPVTGRTERVAPDTAAAPDGLLPVLLVAGESIWHLLSGQGFELDIRRDPTALLGYRVAAIGSGPFAIVMLAILEARHQATGADGVLVNRLTGLWREADARRATGNTNLNGKTEVTA